MRVKTHHVALVVAIIMSLTGCATLPGAAHPSNLNVATFEECLDKAQKVFARADLATSAEKAAATCTENRRIEADRSTAAANAAAQAAIAEGRVYGRYNGQWYGPGLYDDIYYWDNPMIGGRGGRITHAYDALLNGGRGRIPR